jgi:predicted ester cyclase
MDQVKKNKKFIMTYYNAISGVRKPVELCKQFISVQRLIDNIQFWDGALPAYELMADEVIAEGNRVVVRARMKGRHEGILNGIPATHRSVDLPFVIGYEVENNTITDFWLFADQVLLMEQLGANQSA